MQKLRGTTTLTPEETIPKPKITRKKRSKTLTGYGLHLQISDQLGAFSLAWMENWNDNPRGERPNLHEIYSTLALTQQVFPDLFITSNKAEQFNSVHDREINYRGRRSLSHARSHLKSWLRYQYRPKVVESVLKRNPIRIPFSIVRERSALALK